MAYRMKEQGELFSLLFTATGRELPELHAHIARVVADLGVELITPPGPSLISLIEEYNTLPSFHLRFCTRQTKIVPCIAYLRRNPGSTLCVGLRADEDTRVGLYGDYANYRYPLREWGMDQAAVWAYLRNKGIKVPKRTDCDFCPFQRLYEWHDLWREHPENYASSEALEAKTGHTFRSAQRDTWPAALKDMRVRFEAGDVPKRRRLHVTQGEDTGQQACRVCRG